jgi:hypothetical protein
MGKFWMFVVWYGSRLVYLLERIIMIIYNDNGNPIAANIEMDYKGYCISIDCDPSEYPKVFITLNGEEVGTDPFDLSEVSVQCTLQDAIEWIEEDIKCREEESS